MDLGSVTIEAFDINENYLVYGGHTYSSSSVNSIDIPYISLYDISTNQNLWTKYYNGVASTQLLSVYFS